MARSINNLLDTPSDEPFAIDHLQHATDRNRVIKPVRTGILTKSWDGFQELEIDFFQIHEYTFRVGWSYDEGKLLCGALLIGEPDSAVSTCTRSEPR